MTSRRIGLLAAVGIVAVLSAGCGVADAGAAARVGDARISDRDVADAVATLKEQPGIAAPDVAVATNATVRRLVLAALVAQGATREGVTVTESDLDKLITDSAKSAGGLDKLEQGLATNDFVPRGAVRDYARTYLLQQAIGTKLAPAGSPAEAVATTSTAYLAKLSVELDTEIAARFGTWTPADLGIGPVPADLAAPAMRAATPTR